MNLSKSLAKDMASLLLTLTPEEFKSWLMEYSGNGGDASALMAYGAHSLPRIIAQRADIRYFEVLDMLGLMNAKIMTAVLVHVAHREDYKFFREIFSFWPIWSEGGDTRKLDSLLAYFNDDHDVGARLDVLSDLGLLDLSDTCDPRIDAWITCVLARKDIAAMRILVEKGLPGDHAGSTGLRMSAWCSEDVAYAEFFISHGAKVEDYGFQAIRLALKEGNLTVANYLLGLVTADIAVIKSLHEDVDWNLLELSRAAPVA